MRFDKELLCLALTAGIQVFVARPHIYLAADVITDSNQIGPAIMCKFIFHINMKYKFANCK